jgi:gluconolactonase
VNSHTISHAWLRSIRHPLSYQEQSNFMAPNGIAFSPDERYLHITDSASRAYWLFEVQPDGTISKGTLFFDMNSSSDKGLPDGIKVDTKRNVMAWVLAASGSCRQKESISGPSKLPKALPTWHDADRKALYLTAGTGFYRSRLSATGIRP